MLIFLALVFIEIWILVTNLFLQRDWKIGVIISAVIFKTLLVVVTEVLSLFGWITFWGLAIMWFLIFMIGFFWIWQIRKKSEKLLLPEIRKPEKVSYWLIEGIIVLVLLITLSIAIAAPPNTADVLVTDMPRVAYWAQAGAVRHFTAPNEWFNNYVTGVDDSALQIYVLAQGHQLIPLIGWLTFLGSIIAVSALTEELGINRTGTYFAALLIATMPVVITHASSAKNDLPLAFWVIVAIVLAIRLIRNQFKWIEAVLLGASIGLAILTKESAVVFLFPIGIWIIYRLIKRLGWKRLLLAGLVIILVALSLNAGVFIRNLITFGSLTDETNVNRFRNEAFSLPILASTIVRDLSLQAQTPYPWTRAWITEKIVAIHNWLGVDPSDPRITMESDFEVPGLITSEVVSGNPFQTALILLSLVIFWISIIWKRPSNELIAVSVCSVLAFVLFSAIFKWQVFGARYQFPVWFMAAPVTAYLIAWIDRKGWISVLLGIIMFALSSLWLFSLQSRPIIPWLGMTQETSVFQDSDRLLFPSEESYAYFKEMGAIVSESDCKQVGLRVRGSSMSYLYWYALGKPASDIQIEYLVAGTPSARYFDPDFTPCAVICEDCTKNQSELYGLPLYRHFGYFSLYLTSDEGADL